MANNSIFKYSQFNDSTISGSPFWSDGSKQKSIFKKILFYSWKWLKIFIFIFMLVIGLWGCFQNFWDKTITQNPTIGNCLEFGFPFAKTGDYRFDLQMSPIATQYNTLSSWQFSFSGCHNPFYSLFVWPASYAVIKFMWLTRQWPGGLNALLAIFLLLLFIRILTIVISIKSIFQNEKMNAIQTQVAEINAKYKDCNDLKSKQLKQQEILALYKKNNVKPFSSFSQMFLTLPIFLIVYKVVTIVRPIKVTILFSIWNFAAAPLSQIFSNFLSGGWLYIFFLLLVIGSQILSVKIPQIISTKKNKHKFVHTQSGNKQYKKNQKTQFFFLIFMCAIVSFSAVGVGIYWILNSIFTILQSWLVHILLEKKKNSNTIYQKITFKI